MNVFHRHRRALLAASALGLGVATVAAAAAQRSPRQLLQAFLDTLNAHDLQAFRALYVDDGYVQHQTLVIHAEQRSGGPDAAVEYFRQRIAAFPDLQVSSDMSLIEGDKMAANLIWTGTHRGEYLGVPATGKRVTFNSTDLMKARGGLFVEHWGAADLLGLLKQLRG